MSNTPSPEFLTEAAGVKIYMTPHSENDREPSVDRSVTGKIYVTLLNERRRKTAGKSCGFHLTKSKWDPYPWVSYVEPDSCADVAGLRTGDCLVGINGYDLLGIKIKQIAPLIHDQEHEVDIKLSVWRYPDEKDEQQVEGLALKGPLTDVASKLVNAVSGAVRVLECPVCLESSTPPVSQCVHGHIICFGCRPRTSRCPVCRVRLGQGRCLLADKLYKIFRDIFDVNEDLRDNATAEVWSLKDRLFGRSKKKLTIPAKSNSVASKARRLLLTKLFLGGLEKAASADNLTVVPENGSESRVTNEVPIDYGIFNERLNLHDRTKSASTGELSKERKNGITNDTSQTGATSSAVSSTASLASSAPQTPTWGGSIDSVSCMQITCPLSKTSGCKDIVTPGMLLEHLNRTHEVPQVHFHSASIRIPFPLPFGTEAVYILHHAGDLFLFQSEQESVWMTCATSGSNMWEWTLHGQGKGGTEIKLRRSVASLEDPLILSSQNVAPLPTALLLNTLVIKLLECNSQENLGM